MLNTQQLRAVLVAAFCGAVVALGGCGGSDESLDTDTSPRGGDPVVSPESFGGGEEPPPQGEGPPEAAPPEPEPTPPEPEPAPPEPEPEPEPEPAPPPPDPDDQGEQGSIPLG
jgi:hypothetical protein